jgi:hypothetical protein
MGMPRCASGNAGRSEPKGPADSIRDRPATVVTLRREPSGPMTWVNEEPIANRYHRLSTAVTAIGDGESRYVRGRRLPQRPLLRHHPGPLPAARQARADNQDEHPERIASSLQPPRLPSAGGRWAPASAGARPFGYRRSGRPGAAVTLAAVPKFRLRPAVMRLSLDDSRIVGPFEHSENLPLEVATSANRRLRKEAMCSQAFTARKDRVSRNMHSFSPSLPWSPLRLSCSCPEALPAFLARSALGSDSVGEREGTGRISRPVFLFSSPWNERRTTARALSAPRDSRIPGGSRQHDRTREAHEPGADGAGAGARTLTPSRAAEFKGAPERSRGSVSFRFERERRALGWSPTASVRGRRCQRSCHVPLARSSSWRFYWT